MWFVVLARTAQVSRIHCYQVCYLNHGSPPSATCTSPVLQEAAASAGVETERRLRGEIEREKELVRGAEGSVSALSKRLEEALKEVSEKEAAAGELRNRLEEVQVWEGWRCVECMALHRWFMLLSQICVFVRFH